MNRIPALIFTPILALAALLYLAGELMLWVQGRQLTGVVASSAGLAGPASTSSTPFNQGRIGSYQIFVDLPPEAGSPSRVEMRVGASFGDLKPGDKIQVRALRPKPPWIVWSPLVQPYAATVNVYAVGIALLVLAISVYSFFDQLRPPPQI